MVRDFWGQKFSDLRSGPSRNIYFTMTVCKKFLVVPGRSFALVSSYHSVNTSKDQSVLGLLPHLFELLDPRSPIHSR